DLGLLRSYAAFDYLRTYNGRPFRMQDHLNRFRNSARALNLDPGYSDDEIRRIIVDLLGRSDVPDVGVRLVITGGNSPDSITSIAPNFLVTVEQLPEYGEECWTKGVKLITSEYLRDSPGVKSTGYLNAIKLLPTVRQHGAHDMLYCHEGRVLELTRDNFFLFKGDTLVTPGDDILLGITRMVVLELSDGVFPVEERDVYTSELGEATEAFLCGTTKGVMPVVTLDNSRVGNGSVGPNTHKLMDMLARYVDRVSG
ncbi:MAG: aminotransferase class IV, partial [Candidatus Latescibacterota bacterium]